MFAGYKKITVQRTQISTHARNFKSINPASGGTYFRDALKVLFYGSAFLEGGSAAHVFAEPSSENSQKYLYLNIITI